METIYFILNIRVMKYIILLISVVISLNCYPQCNRNNGYKSKLFEPNLYNGELGTSDFIVLTAGLITTVTIAERIGNTDAQKRDSAVLTSIATTVIVYYVQEKLSSKYKKGKIKRKRRSKRKYLYL